MLATQSLVHAWSYILYHLYELVISTGATLFSTLYTYTYNKRGFCFYFTKVGTKGAPIIFILFRIAGCLGKQPAIRNKISILTPIKTLELQDYFYINSVEKIINNNNIHCFQHLNFVNCLNYKARFKSHSSEIIVTVWSRKHYYFL